MRLRKMLRAYIAAEGLSQKDVATEMGISQSLLSRFLTGDCSPSADAYARVIAWCSGAPAPTVDALARIEALEVQVGELNRRKARASAGY